MTHSTTPQEPPKTPVWEGWSPDWQGSPHGLQERHSPTLPHLLRGSSGQAQPPRRRLLDQRLWDALTPPQQDAALEIARACQLLSRGIGFAQSDWAKTPGNKNNDVAGEFGRLSGLYTRWYKECARSGVNHGSVIDILIFGQSCRAQDRDRKLRSGSSKRNLQAGLSLYCRLRGWPER